MSKSNSQRATGKATISLLLATLFAVVMATVHVIEPETNFGAISLYSLGPYGAVMRAGFIVLGLTFFSLVAGLGGHARPAALYRVDLIMLSIAGAGLITIGAFNTDAPGTGSTVSGLIHSLAANVWSICAIIGILLFAVAFRQDGKSLCHRTIIKEFRNSCVDDLSWRVSRTRNLPRGSSA
jgi:hypothetical protein